VEIVVTIKHVPDPNIPPASMWIDESGRQVVVPQGIPPVMNGYDANALEAALRLREQHGGNVSVVSFGDDGARDTLRRAIAMGADSAMLVTDASWAEFDSAQTARVLAAAIQRLGAIELILCGRQASDTDAGQTHFRLAQALGLPAVSPVRQIEQFAGGSAVLMRITEDGGQRVRVTLPALFGVSSESYEPRYPSLKGILAANRAQIPVTPLVDLGIDVARLVELRRVYLESRSSNVELIEGEDGTEIGIRLADRLREAGVI
jgi:electron transfer flavoprotein beta subunit